MKVQWDEFGGRILLGDNAGGVAVKLQPIRFHCIRVWISAGITCLCVYKLTMRIFNYVLRQTLRRKNTSNKNDKFMNSIDYILVEKRSTV
jgi:hypothetical protein